MSAMLSHAEARDTLLRAWVRKYGVAPRESVLRIVQAIGLGEGQYGHAFGDINNWAAHQDPKDAPPCTPPNALVTDSRPPRPGEENDPRRDPKYGGNIPFGVCMKGFATPAEGALDFVSLLGPTVRPKTWAALKTADIPRIAKAMYVEHYYGGFGDTVKQRVDGYVRFIRSNKRIIDAALGGGGGEKLAITSDTIRSYLTRVNDGYEALNQRVVAVMAGGASGPPQSKAAWEYINGWQIAYAEWNQFYWGQRDDLWLPDSTWAECAVYHETLLKYAKRCKAALGVDAPPMPEKARPEVEGGAGAGVGTYVTVGLAIAGVVAVGYVIRSVYRPA